MATTITTEQNVAYTLKVVDGRGRPIAIDGLPKASSADETVVRVGDVTPTANPSEWTFTADSVTAGVASIAVTVDLDVTEGVNELIGLDEMTVTLDPRTGARTIAITAGTPTDRNI